MSQLVLVHVHHAHDRSSALRLLGVPYRVLHLFVQFESCRNRTVLIAVVIWLRLLDSFDTPFSEDDVTVIESR